MKKQKQKIWGIHGVDMKFNIRYPFRLGTVLGCFIFFFCVLEIGLLGKKIQSQRYKITLSKKKKKKKKRKTKKPKFLYKKNN